MTRIAFINGAVSPFQCDVARAAARRGLDLQLLFNSRPSLHGRPKHWENWHTVSEDMARFGRVAPHGINEGQMIAWFAAQLEELRPDIVIAASYKPWARDAALAYAKAHGLPLGLWAEQPQPAPWWKTVAKRAYIARQMRGYDFCFAIGERAASIYGTALGNHDRTFMIPYAQDLDAFDPAQRPARTDDDLRVLFSGGFHERHNFDLIVEAMKRIETMGLPRKTRYLFSGNGPERKRLDDLVRENPSLGERIEIYDQPFRTFEERAKHYLLADLFLYPSRHAGWGLVVPEAMAAGMPIISTTNVEAARFYVEHGMNGVFVDQTADSITEALARLLSDPELLRNMGERARTSALRGSADAIAERMHLAFSYMGIAPHRLDPK
jgi:glycosyltransferase involved in cell wall biosynthesis